MPGLRGQTCSKNSLTTPRLARRSQHKQACEELQESLSGLTDWAETWGIQFKMAKCKVMYLSSRNPKLEYKIAGKMLRPRKKVIVCT